MNMRHRPRLLLALLACALPSVASAQYVWDTNGATTGTGGTGTWNAGTPWFDGTSFVAWSNGNAAIFGGTAGTVTVSDNVTTGTNGTQWNTTGYTLTPSNTTTRTVGGNFVLDADVGLTLFESATTANRTLTLSGTSFTGGAGASLNIVGSPTVSSAARINFSSANTVVDLPVNITSSGPGIVGLVATANGVTVNGTVTNNSTSGYAMIGATSGNTLSLTSGLAGSGNWQFSAGSAGGAGLITLNSTATATGNTTINISTTGVLRLGADNAISTGNLQFGNTSGSPGSNENTGAIDLNGFNQSVMSLSNAGSGNANGITNTTTTLSTLTITGSATTSCGTLLVNGNQSSATGAVTVASTGTLGGGGTIGGATTVQSGGTIRGGSGTGTGQLTVGNTVIENGGSLMANLGESGTNSSLAVGANSLNVKTGSVLKLDGVAGFSNTTSGTYILASLSDGNNILADDSGSLAGDFDLGTYLHGTTPTKSGVMDIQLGSGLTLNNGDRLELRRSGNDLVLTFSPVPEPASLLAVCGLATGGFAFVRRLRRKANPTELATAA
jgi:fibronectin-binding autotransporter adhesin